MHKGTLTVTTSKHMELVDITPMLQGDIGKAGIAAGILYIFNPHTTAAITINEGADPDVQRDILSALQEIVPMKLPYRHMEGNSPAHVMSSIIGTSESVFVDDGRLQLGTWQKIFFCEFDGPRTRKIHWRLL